MRISDWSSDVCSSDLMSAQAFHYLHRRCSLALKARCQRAEAALRKKAVVRGNAKAEVAAGVLDLPVKPFVVHRHAAEDQVGVAADVLRQRLDSDVGAVAQRLEAERRGPGAVGGDQRAAVVRGPRDGRSEEHTYELQSLMRNSDAVFCL